MQGLAEYLSKFPEDELEKMRRDRQYRRECIRKYKKSIRKMLGGAAVETWATSIEKVTELPEGVKPIGTGQTLNIDLSGASGDSYKQSVDVYFASGRISKNYLISKSNLPEEFREPVLKDIIPFKGFKYSGDLRTIKGSQKCGFEQCGNTCYENAMFQCLLNTEMLKNFFTNGNIDFMNCWGEKVVFNLNTFIKQENKFFLYFINLFRIYHTSKCSGFINLTDFRNLYPSDMNEFKRVGRQRDAQELYGIFIQKMDESLTGEAQRMLTSPSDNFTGAKPSNEIIMQILYKQLGYQKLIYENENYKIRELFSFMLLSILKCPNPTCESRKFRFDTATTLTLELTKVNESDYLDLAYLIGRFSNIEQLGEDYKVDCEVEGSRERFYKKILMCNYPPILVIHLKRFWSTYESRIYQHGKISIPITMPYEINKNELRQYFNFNDQLSEFYNLNIQDDSPAYILYAVLIHQGNSQNSGHYYSYCINSNDSKWYKYNDGMVTLTSGISEINEDILQNGYMYFYKRI